MEKFAALEPVRLHAATTRPIPGRVVVVPLIGSLPRHIHLLVLRHLSIPDFPSYSLVSRATALLIRDESIWKMRWRALDMDERDMSLVLDQLEAEAATQSNSDRQASVPPILAAGTLDDDFGEFTSSSSSATHLATALDAFQSLSVAATAADTMGHSFRAKYMRAHGC